MGKELFIRAQKMKDSLIQWRRSLHRHPELGLELPRTSAFVQNELNRLGISYETYVDGSCLLAKKRKMFSVAKRYGCPSDQ